MRYTLARLLAEEEDAVRLSLGVSRVKSASARVERTLHAIGNGESELQEWVSNLLMTVEEEQRLRAEGKLPLDFYDPRFPVPPLPDSSGDASPDESPDAGFADG